ncbi:MAG: SDR family NAD(P)-dependent oxidoreductase [Haliea sp.]|uniref:SDR family NAD(P)-dependent oxidoreductase n=1 Tax=Haliea sp. TaxID=1932666 RepID=UPI0032ED7E37
MNETVPSELSSAEFGFRYGPTALVTGASSGIGHAFATELAGRGLDLLLVARRSDRLRALAAELEQAHGVAVQVCAADLAAPGAVDQVIDAAAGRDIGLLVSNAGFGLKGAHQDNDPARMTAMLQVNCAAPLQLTHRLLPGLLRRGRGGIVITSSVEGLMGVPYSAAYAASKAFTNSLGESLWGEVSPRGVDVLALCPGSTATEAHALQGIDSATLEGVMSPQAVVLEALANLGNGPVYVAGEQNQAMFTALTGMPRREALLQMAANIRAALLPSGTRP